MGRNANIVETNVPGQKQAVKRSLATVRRNFLKRRNAQRNHDQSDLVKGSRVSYLLVEKERKSLEHALRKRSHATRRRIVDTEIQKGVCLLVEKERKSLEHALRKRSPRAKKHRDVHTRKIKKEKLLSQERRSHAIKRKIVDMEILRNVLNAVSYLLVAQKRK